MPDAVHISKISLTDFRNYRALRLDLAPGAVVLTGENGAGKTNLLEAISFLSPGRGLRRATYAEVAREGAGGGFAVSAHWTARAASGQSAPALSGAKAGQRRPGACGSMAPMPDPPTSCWILCA